MGKNKKKTFLYVIGFLTHFLFLCYLHPLTLQAQTKKEEIDITALSKQIEQLGEEKYPDFSSIFGKILSMQFTEVFQQIGGWFIDIAFREVFFFENTYYRAYRCHLIFGGIFEYLFFLSTIWSIGQWIFCYISHNIFYYFY